MGLLKLMIQAFAPGAGGGRPKGVPAVILGVILGAALLAGPMGSAALAADTKLPASTKLTSGKDMTALAEELQCLALNIYWEARSEPPQGQMAVAAVTLNRVAHPGFPDTVCAVVKQGGEKVRNRCQFSWWCDGKKDEPTNAESWNTAQILAFLSLIKGPHDPTDGALFYHADYVKPGWTRKMERVTKIGRHIYYRKPTRAVELASAPAR